jgi:ABC-type transport system involved in multi-copper enzyme maturation permease subunit
MAYRVNRRDASTTMTGMSSTTMIFGVLLMLLGGAGYYLTGAASPTALIPTWFGLPLVALGYLSRSEAMRKHAMHAAATIGLVGCAGALFSLVRTPAGPTSAMATFSQAAMVLLTAVFVGLCVKSFKDARRARSARA